MKKENKFFKVVRFLIKKLNAIKIGKSQSLAKHWLSEKVIMIVSNKQPYYQVRALANYPCHLLLITLVKYSPNSTFLIVSDVQRPIRANR